MGTASFLLGANAQFFRNIDETVEDLRDASVVFMRRVALGETARAEEVSLRAFECFDHIVGELMRIRDDRKRAGQYDGTAFQQAMAAMAASMVEPVSLTEQAAMAAAGAGNGQLPVGKAPVRISLEKTLNKIKHRHRMYLNFRIDGGRHIFLVCPNGPDAIVEFDVNEFCNLCRNASAVL